MRLPGSSYGQAQEFAVDLYPQNIPLEVTVHFSRQQTPVLPRWNDLFVPLFQAIVKQAATTVQQGTVVGLNSPANLLITDSKGRRVGFDSSTNTTDLQILGAVYSGFDTHPQTIYLPSNIIRFTVQVVGTNNGAYTLSVQSLNATSSLLKLENGTIAKNQVISYEVQTPSSTTQSLTIKTVTASSQNPSLFQNQAIIIIIPIIAVVALAIYLKKRARSKP